MYIALKNPSFLKVRFFSPLALFLFWFSGFSFGAITGISSDPLFLSLMPRAASSPMSIVGLLSVICLPFLFTALSDFIKFPRLLYFISFFKAFSFGFVSVLAKLSFGNIHWLIKSMLLFSDMFSSFVLLVLWHRILKGSAGLKSILVGWAISLAVGVFDICFISPFLASMIEKW